MSDISDPASAYLSGEPPGRRDFPRRGRRSQLLWLAINLTPISRSRAVCPISPKALTANNSRAVAKIAGSSPTVLVVHSNCLL